MTRSFLLGLIPNLVACFRLKNVAWQVLAALLTFGIVESGFDWRYFEATRTDILFKLSLPAAIIGFFVPIILPIALYAVGEWRKNATLLLAGSAVAQAGIAALLISSLYKAFTGRLQPEFYTHTSSVDISRVFHFGFLQHGVFWGWPSSHAAIAFAGSLALMTIYPRIKSLRVGAILYALYIALGVSISIHWFSDAVAGAIIGSVVGATVANGFLKRNAS